MDKQTSMVNNHSIASGKNFKSTSDRKRFSEEIFVYEDPFFPPIKTTRNSNSEECILLVEAMKKWVRVLVRMGNQNLWLLHNRPIAEFSKYFSDADFIKAGRHYIINRSRFLAYVPDQKTIYFDVDCKVVLKRRIARSHFTQPKKVLLSEKNKWLSL
jgi:hypothetical protein